MFTHYNSLFSHCGSNPLIIIIISSLKSRILSRKNTRIRVDVKWHFSNIFLRSLPCRCFSPKVKLCCTTILLKFWENFKLMTPTTTTTNDTSTNLSTCHPYPKYFHLFNIKHFRCMQFWSWIEVRYWSLFCHCSCAKFW